jgi:hypothetical protein
LVQVHFEVEVERWATVKVEDKIEVWRAGASAF